MLAPKSHKTFGKCKISMVQGIWKLHDTLSFGQWPSRNNTRILQLFIILLHDNLKAWHTTSNLSIARFPITWWNIGPNLFIFVTIFVPVVVVITIVVSIPEIVSLSIIVSVVFPLVFLTLERIIRVRTFIVGLKTTRFIIYRIHILLIITFLNWWWWTSY